MAIETHAWDRYEAWWHAGFVATVVIALGSLVVDSGAARERLLAAGCVVALTIWYVAMSRRQRHLPGQHWDAIAAGGTIVLFLAGFAVHPAVAVLLFSVYPLLFGNLADLRYSIPAVTALTVGVAAVNAARAGWTAGGSLIAIGVGAVYLAFAIAFGVWITRIIEQSRDRAGLIEQLEATREELAEAHREAGAAAERQRLALEIHDTLAQGFTSLVMLVQAAEAEVGRHDEQVRRYLALAERTARENLGEARSLVTQLGPTPLQAASLSDAIARLTERFDDETSVRATFELTGTPRPLAASADVVLLRVVQEALNNVRRHAAASKLTVKLCYLDDEVTVEVVDDGCGFEPAQADGFGLRGMRERAGHVDGEVTVRSAPGRGTSVRMRLR
ncbi:MAG: sensor histidine kinase [Actinomycetota bacterium]|nr:sensor histidine kinase [Actinomycetota bacterium]